MAQYGVVCRTCAGISISHAKRSFWWEQAECCRVLSVPTPPALAHYSSLVFNCCQGADALLHVPALDSATMALVRFLQLNTVSLASSVMTCGWASVVAECSFCLPLLCVVPWIIKALCVSSLSVLSICPCPPRHRCSADLKWYSVGTFTSWFPYGFADGLVYSLVEAVVPPRKKDASKVLGEDKVFSARDVV